MSEKTKQPLSAEDYIINEWGAVWALANFDWKGGDVIEALDDYAGKVASPLHVRIAELEAENVKYFKELMGLRCYKVDSNHTIERLEADLAAEKQKAERL